MQMYMYATVVRTGNSNFHRVPVSLDYLFIILD